MEHGPKDTPTAEPPAPSQQSPPTALPSPGEPGSPLGASRKSFLGSLKIFLQLGSTAQSAAQRNAAVGGCSDGGGAEALAMGMGTTREEWVAAGEEPGKSGDGVEGAAVGGNGLQACVGTWGGEMEERAEEAARAILERKRAKDELVELGKEHEALQAETERLRLRFVEMVKQGKRQAEDWRDPLWLTANGVLQQFDSAKAEGERVGAKLKRARKQFERSEKLAERMMLELGRVMSGERESVAAVAGAEVEVEVAEVEVEEQEEDAEVETRSEEVVREFARD